MESFLLGVSVGAGLALAVGAPLLAPWPTRLRFLIAAQTPDPVLGLPVSGMEMREVTIDAVRTKENVAEVLLLEGRAGVAGRHRRLVGASAAPGLVAKLEGWCAAGVPLLLIGSESRDVELCGPEATAVGLRELDARV
jgi:hypothetical protein